MQMYVTAYVIVTISIVQTTIFCSSSMCDHFFFRNSHSAVSLWVGQSKYYDHTDNAFEPSF